LRKIKVFTASSITQEYTLMSGSFKATGRPDQGHFASVSKETSLNLFLTEEGIGLTCPPFELVEFMATTCGIENQQHRALLQTALTERSIKRIQQTFYREGLLKREELTQEGEQLYLPSAEVRMLMLAQVTAHPMNL